MNIGPGTMRRNVVWNTAGVMVKLVGFSDISMGKRRICMGMYGNRFGSVSGWMESV